MARRIPRLTGPLALALVVVACWFPILRPDPTGSYRLARVDDQALPYSIDYTDNSNRMDAHAALMELKDGAFEQTWTLALWVNGERTDTTHVVTGTYRHRDHDVTFYVDAEEIGRGHLDGAWMFWTSSDGTAMHWEIL